MLSSSGKVSWMWRFRRWMCACIRRSRLDDEASSRLGGIRFAGFLCWCDRADGSGAER
jgi:hypothetical protein